MVKSARRDRPAAPLSESRGAPRVRMLTPPSAPLSGSLRASVRKRRMTPPSKAGTSGAQNGGQPLPALS